LTNAPCCQRVLNTTLLGTSRMQKSTSTSRPASSSLKTLQVPSLLPCHWILHNGFSPGLGASFSAGFFLTDTWIPQFWSGRQSFPLLFFLCGRTSPVSPMSLPGSHDRHNQLTGRRNPPGTFVPRCRRQLFPHCRRLRLPKSVPCARKASSGQSAVTYGEMEAKVYCG
jgi:hypothetical protein